jgi:AsmA-like C-terminal region
MNISADRVVWEELSELVDRGSKGENNQGILGIPLPPLEGTVRLKADNFTLAGFSWSPLQATASLSPQGIRGEVERGDVCGIGTVGSVDFTDEEIGLDVSLSVTDGQLESTSLCLTDNKQAVKGNYSLKAQVTGRGTPGKVAQTLRGEFEFSAQDGQIEQSPTEDTPLEATFDYLNKTGDFNVAFPDLDRESFPFRLIRSRGRVEGTTLVNDVLIIQSSLFTITGNGRIDVEHKQIDAKGLVSVLMPGDSIIRRIPIVGSLLGGSILGIPVRVTGSLEHPDVTYLSPTDVGAELLNIPMRILGLPLDAIRLFTPNFREPEKQ